MQLMTSDERKWFYGGESTPKSLTVDLCINGDGVYSNGAQRLLAVGAMRVATYNGKVTKRSLKHVKEALASSGARFALVWRNGQWDTIASRG